MTATVQRLSLTIGAALIAAGIGPARSFMLRIRIRIHSLRRFAAAGWAREGRADRGAAAPADRWACCRCCRRSST